MKKYILLVSLLALLCSAASVAAAAPWEYTGDYVPGAYKYVPPANDYVPTGKPIINSVPTYIPGAYVYVPPVNNRVGTYTPPANTTPAYVAPKSYTYSGTCTGRIDARICPLRTGGTTYSSPSDQARACLSVQQRTCSAQRGSFNSPYCKRETIFTANGCAVVTACPWTCTVPW